MNRTVTIDREAYDRARTALARIVFESQAGCLRGVGDRAALDFAQEAYAALPSLAALEAKRNKTVEALADLANWDFASIDADEAGYESSRDEALRVLGQLVDVEG